MEQYVDFNAATTVASGGYTAGSGVLNVGSTASPFPSSGTFSVLIQNNTTGETVVLLRVSAVNSGTQWAVAAEGSDANASAGYNVYAVLSVDGLNQIRSDICQMGTYASLPTSIPVAGTQYICTDCQLNFFSNGSAWIAFFMGIPVTVTPLTASFTKVGTGTMSDATGGLLIVGNSSAITWWTIASPSVPFTFTAAFYQVASGEGAAIGIVTSDGTKYERFQLYGNTPTVMGVYYRATATGGDSLLQGATQNSSSIPFFAPVIFFRMVLDSTHRTFYVGDGSVDGWVQFYQESATANLTTSEIGVFMYGGSDANGAFRIVSFSS
jgi:hypothetical protein